MLLLAWFSRLVDRRIILWGLIIAGLLWAGIQKTQSLITEQPAQPVVTKQPAYLQSPFSTEMSDQARWDANRHAFEMWLQSPITGAGLGVFAAKSAQWFNFPMIIHSTPIWILAEFGLIGIAIFGAFFYMMLRHVFNDWKRWPKLPAERALLFALLAFAIFSQVHEMLYQRILWLMLGVLLARPSIASTVVSVSKGPK
jgi:O-antigen ligase